MKSGIHPSLELGTGSEEGTSVGAYLRSCRLRQGQDLQQIANVLRIKYDYLQAIENDRLEDLPGHIYSTGFIRTYSEYLGLDGEELIQKLKAEVSALAQTPKLVFPAIIPEDGIPGGVIVMAGLLIAFLGYFTWYWTTSSDHSVAQSVPAMPKELANLTKKNEINPSITENNSLVEASSAVAAPAKLQVNSGQNDLTRQQSLTEVQSYTKSNQNAAKIVRLPEAPHTLESEVTHIEPSQRGNNLVSEKPRSLTSLINKQKNTDDLSNDATLEPQDIGPNLAPASQLSSQKLGNIVTTENSQEIKPREKITSGASSNPVPTIPNSLAKPNPMQAAFDDNVPDTLSELPDRVEVKVATFIDASARPDKLANFAQPNKSDKKTLAPKNTSEIKIFAENTSWIQLRDIRENRVILSKVLLKGQSYKVPNDQRLSLMTGNAGALEITVNGEAVPKIGKLGEVRREVLLEVESLKLGRAVVE